MARLLFTTLPHEGHLNPTFGIAAALRERGHEIVYLEHPLIRKRIREQGFDTTPFRAPALSDLRLMWRKWRLERSAGVAEMRNALRLFTTGLKEQTHFIRRVIDREKPDLLVNDVFHYAGSLGAECAAIPWADCWTAGVMHPASAIRPPGVTVAEMHAMLRGFDVDMNAARRELGLAAREPDAFISPSPWLQIYTGLAELEGGIPELGGSAVFVGPCFPRRKEQTGSFPWAWLEGETPLVYVSLGTFFNKRAAFFRRIIEALGGAPCKVVISSPFADRRGFRTLPDNIRMFRRVPQISLLSQAQLFITHGGNNSVYEALYAGVPMLVTPIGGEQQYNAARVSWLGLGGQAEIGQCSAAELRQQALAILADAAVRERVRQVRDDTRRTNGPAVAATLIERVLMTGRPIRRPAGTPMTLYDHTPLPDWASRPV